MYLLFVNKSQSNMRKNTWFTIINLYLECICMIRVNHTCICVYDEQQNGTLNTAAHINRVAASYQSSTYI